MTFPEFDDFFDKLIAECRSTQGTKGKEYANGESRFGNFDRLAATLGMTREQIALVYLQKHLDSIASYIKTGQVSSTEGIRGRYVDAITYLTLMAGMAEEDMLNDTAELGSERYRAWIGA